MYFTEITALTVRRSLSACRHNTGAVCIAIQTYSDQMTASICAANKMTSCRVNNDGRNKTERAQNKSLHNTDFRAT